MFENIMSVERHSLLERLTQLSLLQDFYLAGGTAAALYSGHRWSEDLDFFTGQEFDSFQFAGKLAEIDGFLLTGQEQGTLHCLIKGVKVSFLFYPYSLLGPVAIYEKVQVAAFTDIALMKLIALVQRGTRKDFIDLYFLDKEWVSFEEMLNLYPRKFPVKTYQPLVLLKSFGYFEDAEREQMPKMFRDVSWDEIKKHFILRQKELTVKVLEGQ